MQQRTNKIVLKNFSFSVGELVIEQTTTDDEVSVPDSALKAIGQVISAPQQLLGIEADGTRIQEPQAPLITPPVQPPPSSKPRRRRRITVSSNGGQPAAGIANPDSVTSQILELKKDGFFKQERDAGEVAAKLHQRGHTTAKPSNVRMTLLHLARDKDLSKKLYRKQDAHKKWTYRADPYEHE